MTTVGQPNNVVQEELFEYVVVNQFYFAQPIPNQLVQVGVERRFQSNLILVNMTYSKSELLYMGFNSTFGGSLIYWLKNKIRLHSLCSV